MALQSSGAISMKSDQHGAAEISVCSDISGYCREWWVCCNKSVHVLQNLVRLTRQLCLSGMVIIILQHAVTLLLLIVLPGVVHTLF